MKQLTSFLLLIGALVIFTNAFAKITTIHFATEATYPPFEYVTPNGNIEGFDVDVMNALCKEVNATCTITNQPFDSLIPTLQLGKFDALIGAIEITPARAAQVDFTNPYYFDTVSFVKSKNSAFTISDSALKGKTVGVQGGTTFEHYLDDAYGNVVNVKLYASNEEALLDLQNGRLDAFLGDTPFIMQWLKKGNNKNYEIVGKPIVNKKYFGAGNGIAVKKGNKELLITLNKAIAKIKANGSLNKIEQKYFGKTK